MKATGSPIPELLPGERIVNIQKLGDIKPKKVPSSIRELERLSRARGMNDVGDHGPVIASESLPERENEPAFHRYEALFGRDALRVVLDLINEYPKLVEITLIKLAQLQGVEINHDREEEPGRIIHESRDPAKDPVARELTKNQGWGWPYYGSVDSTPEYIRAVSAYCYSSDRGTQFLQHTYTGLDKKQHTIADSMVAAVNWLVKRLESNKEGLLEFKRSNPHGIENQVWKDSWDAYFHQDGSMANHTQGIASIEVQRVAHDALLNAAEMYKNYLGREKEAPKLRDYAQNIQKQILRSFWTEDHGGYFVLGTDRDDQGRRRPLLVRSSNMGHLLHSKVLLTDSAKTSEQYEAIVRQLFSPDMFGINGIMTLASNEVRFRPGAYHNGSVWGWDNYYIAQGLRTYGYFGLADYVEQVLMEGINSTRRYIEYLRGGTDPEHRINTNIVDVWDEVNQRSNRLEQPPQDMQAWTAAAVLAIKLRRENTQSSRLAIDAKKRKLELKLLNNLNEHHRDVHGKIPKT